VTARARQQRASLLSSQSHAALMEWNPPPGHCLLQGMDGRKKRADFKPARLALDFSPGGNRTWRNEFPGGRKAPHFISPAPEARQELAQCGSEARIARW